MKSLSKFDTVYSRLNPIQKHAVDRIDGPVMVLAGPGTGKTHVLSARIANILLKTDTPASSILALTFTESAAATMKERVVSMIGKEGYYVNIQTFHSFCAQVIQSYPEYFPIPRGSVPVTELERYHIIEQLLQSLPIEALKPINTPLFYVKDIASAISQIKREGFDYKEFTKVVKESFVKPSKETKSALMQFDKDKKKNEELALLFEAYDKRLRNKQVFDFEDMINLVAHAFETQEELVRTYQEKLLYFLVDEYQDTNSAQNKVVDMLASYWGEKANIFVVGDPHQSIFRFQGASLENVMSFVQKYNQAEIITLEKGYRSPQVIYDAAYSVVSHNQPISDGMPQDLNDGLAKRLVGKSDDDAKIIVQKFPSQIAEVLFIAEKIQQLHTGGVSYKDMSILYRNNYDSLVIQDALEKWDIPYSLQGGMDVLKDEFVNQFLTVLQVIHEVRLGGEVELLYDVFSYDWTPVDKVVVMKAIHAAGRKRIMLDTFIAHGYELYKKEHVDHQIQEDEFELLQTFLQKLQEWGHREYNVAFPAWFEMVLKESGYLEFIIGHKNKIELIHGAQALFSKVKELTYRDHTCNLETFLETVQLMKQYNLGIESTDIALNSDAVYLSTVHKAKGNEWDHVFLTQCIDGKWGNSKSREMIHLPDGLLRNTDVSKKEQSEDDRRLFYVAITRAAEQLYITYPSSIVSEGYRRDTIPSMFIDEIPSELKIESPDSESFLKSFDNAITTFLQPKKSKDVTKEELSYFKYLVDNFSLSVTALNAYLADPGSFVLFHLLRVPSAKKDHMSFGTAIHKSLEKMYTYYQAFHTYPPLSTVEADFQKALEEEILHKDDFTRRLAYGKNMLEKYYAEYSSKDVDTLFVEKSFGSGFSKTYLDDIHLKGKIDRIDLVDRDKKLVRVIDYKTGSAKSKNAIEGMIKSAGLSEREQALPDSIKGPYKRQLLFYKLLTELDREFIPKTIEGVLDFVEPDKRSGKFTRHVFELHDEDVEDLKKLIREVMKEIRGLEFLGSI